MPSRRQELLGLLEEQRQIVANPMCDLLISIGKLEHGKVRMILANDLHAHRQLVVIEADGHVDYRMP